MLQRFQHLACVQGPKLWGPSASTGEHCICIVSDLLWLGLVWSCFVFCLLFLLFYVMCAPVLTEGTKLCFYYANFIRSECHYKRYSKPSQKENSQSGSNTHRFTEITSGLKEEQSTAYIWLLNVACMNSVPILLINRLCPVRPLSRLFLFRKWQKY